MARRFTALEDECEPGSCRQIAEFRDVLWWKRAARSEVGDSVEVVREQILLAMPEQVFCWEDCKGLCPKCGTNLNLIDCKCADDEVDPRWAALKSLK